MGSTLRRRIICCWSSLRAKTVSLPVQSLCSWIQNTVNAFGMITKKTLTWLWQAGALSETRDIPWLQQETQEQPGQGTDWWQAQTQRLREDSHSFPGGVKYRARKGNRMVPSSPLPELQMQAHPLHTGHYLLALSFYSQPLQGSPSVSGNDGWELHFLGSCVSKVPAMV